MRRVLFTSVLCLLVSLGSFAQSNQIKFKKTDINPKTQIENEGYVFVNFSLLGVIDEAKRTEIEDLLNASPDIKDCSLKLSGKCGMFIKQGVTADQIRATYLLPNYVDYDFVSVEIIDESLNGGAPVELPDDFPQYIDTGNPEQDRINHRNAKDQWIENNPEKYDELNSKALDANQIRRNEIIQLERTKLTN